MYAISKLGLAIALAGSSLMACETSTSSGADMGNTAGPDIPTTDMSPPPPPPPGSLQFTASGAWFARTGYAFPPVIAGDRTFVDGWEVNFEELLVTLDNISLFENPDKSDTDQSQTDAKVASVTGPWAVDLQQGGPLPGKGSVDERAVALATLTNQNLNGNLPFSPDKRYAFGFDMIPAAVSARNVNLTAQGQSDYSLMIQKGWTVLYAGTATYRGTVCTSTNPLYDFTKLPPVVKFKIGFASPTSYLNCQNPDNGTATPLPNEDYQRGIKIPANAVTVVQVTMNADPPFGESILHNSQLHFDQLAAVAKKDANNNYVLTEADLKGANFTAFKDAAGAALPWRSCMTTYTPPNTAMSMNFDSLGIPYNPTGNATRVLRDYLDFATFSQSAQGYLNDGGRCFVKRNYPAPQ